MVMTVGHTRLGWRVVGVGFALHALGVALDFGYHLAHPHAASAPYWAHLPIYLGAAALLIATASLLRGHPEDRWLQVATVGAVVEVLALVWSVSVRAEANDFYVPAAIGVVGGGATFVALTRTWLDRRRRTASRP